MDDKLYQEKKDFVELESVARFWVGGMLKEIWGLIKYFISGFLLAVFFYFGINNFSKEYFIDYSNNYINVKLENFDKILRNSFDILNEDKILFTFVFTVIVLVIIPLIWKQIKNISRNLLHFTKLERFVFFLFGFLFVLMIFFPSNC